ncbi:MAG: hypothetical protein ABIS36_19975 [Chryseolinea sp.]
MELRDLIVTPFYLALIYVVAYGVRSRMTDEITRRYFIPALTVRIIGALALGFIYDFYYQGGDTFSYHKFGSRHIWEAFMDSPATGLKLMFSDGVDQTGIYKYSSKILFFTDPSSYNVVRVAAVLDLFTFSTYSSTALLFAVFSFIGMWLFFTTFYKRYPELHRWLALACFFIPSVFFWGSGLLKDTITLGCLGIATYAVSKLFIERKPTIKCAALLAGSLFGIFSIKVYIILTFLPAVIVWVSMTYLDQLRSMSFKIITFPFIVTIAILLSYFAALKAGEGDEKYSLDKLARTAQVTAYDIRYYTGKNAGSGYTLGELDGTFSSMIALAPQAVNVTLFRPYLWEVKNPFMLISSIESLGLFLFTLYVMYKKKLMLFRSVWQPDIFFSLTFSIAFAFAVGASTFNFGTLVRYKIPLMPFYFIALLLMLNQSNNDKKFDELELTE